MFSLVALALFGADVHALGSDSFEARQRASARLEAHAWLSWRPFQHPILHSPLFSPQGFRNADS